MTDQTATQATSPQDRRDQELEQLRRSIRSIMTANRRHVDRLTDAHEATIGELRRAEARVRVLEATGQAKKELAPGVREVRIVVQAPSDENAGQWAETIRDLVVAEYGDSMRLEVTILPGGRA